MKRVPELFAVTMLAFVGTLGCVPGYNSLLFTTQTNVGFVVETKPPEVSIDIARQELLIAPTYEQGKTPPVLASFRYENQDIFSNYIGSVFTTGDASVAMSRLYDAGDWPKAKGDGVWDITPKEWEDQEKLFDSSVRLSMVPKYPSWVPAEEPGTVRPLLFMTDTSTGFKVSWASMESPYPDYVQLAYKRKELAFAAVTIGPEFGEDGKPTRFLKARTPSLLATVDVATEVGEFPQLKFEYLQYFASGRAATALAMRHEIRKAMLRRLDPETVKEGFGAAVEGGTADVSLSLLTTVYDLMKDTANDPTKDAEVRSKALRLKKQLDSLSDFVPATYPFTLYDLKAVNVYEAVVKSGDPVAGAGYDKVATYLGNLNGAVEVLVEMKKIAGDITIDGVQPSAVKLAEEEIDVVKIRDDFLRELGKQPAWLDAMRYAVELFEGK